MTIEGDSLSGLVDEFLDEEFELSPVTASALGLTDYDAGMDDLSAESFAERERDARDFLARFAALADADLTAEERIDRDLALAMLRGRLITAEWQGWKRDPLTYSGPALNGVFLLFLHRLRPEQELVDAAVSRLAQIPTVFAQGRANLDPALAHPLIVERALASARAGARYVRDLLPARGTRRGVVGAAPECRASPPDRRSTIGRCSSRGSRPRHAARGSSARNATAARSRNARRCRSTRAAFGRMASRSWTGWMPRCRDAR